MSIEYWVLLLGLGPWRFGPSFFLLFWASDFFFSQESSTLMEGEEPKSTLTIIIFVSYLMTSVCRLLHLPRSLHAHPTKCDKPFFNYTAQDTARSASNSSQSAELRALFSPRVSQNVDGHPLDARVRWPKASVTANGFFSSRNHDRPHRAAQRPDAKHVISRRDWSLLVSRRFHVAGECSSVEDLAGCLCFLVCAPAQLVNMSHKHVLVCTRNNTTLHPEV